MRFLSRNLNLDYQGFVGACRHNLLSCALRQPASSNDKNVHYNKINCGEQ